MDPYRRRWYSRTYSHSRSFGVIFIAVTLALFSFSTFIGILFYARSNVAYLFGDRWLWQTLYKVLALGMLLAVQIAAGVLAFVVMIVLSRHPLVVEVKRQFCRSEKMKMLLRAG